MNFTNNKTTLTIGQGGFEYNTDYVLSVYIIDKINPEA